MKKCLRWISSEGSHLYREVQYKTVTTRSGVMTCLDDSNLISMISIHSVMLGPMTIAKVNRIERERERDRDHEVRFKGLN